MVRERPEKERTAGRSGPLVFLAGAFVLLLLALYVLSIGPVGWLADHGYIDAETPLLGLLYTPLALVAYYFPPLEWALEGYMELFR